MKKARSLPQENLIVWDDLSPGDEVAWYQARTSRVNIQVLGEFGRVVIEGTLAADGADPHQGEVLTPKASLLLNVAVPLHVRPKVLEGEHVTVLMHFVRGSDWGPR